MPRRPKRQSLVRPFDPDAFSWQGVERMDYKEEGEGAPWSGIARSHLAGMFGEKTKFHVRYFEIAPSGQSSMEFHQHEHVVIVVRGSGEVELDGEVTRLGMMDLVYVAPQSIHQFRATAAEPFGFLCIVDAKRDKPVASSCELPIGQEK